MQKIDLKKIIIIIGPTASGKSDLAIKIAKDKIEKENQECFIISADSRQIYKYLDIGSGKITKEEMGGVTHFGLDVAEPGSTHFTAADWLRYTTKKINEIINENKMPIICGGTGLYIDALLYGIDDNPKPDYIFRKTLENKTTDEIKDIMKNKLEENDDLDYFYNLNNSEQNNRNRLIRKLELLNSGHRIKNTDLDNSKRTLRYDVEFIILEPELDILQEKIKLRLEKRLGLNTKKNSINNNAASYACGKESINSSPLISEIKDLIENKKVDPKWLMSLGLEYKYVTEYILGQISYAEMLNTLNIKIFQYAKRQIKWNRRYKELENKFN